MQTHYIPLGTRCSSAFVIRDNLKKREQALPFDWLDMPISAIPQFIKLQSGQEVMEYVNQYFEHVGKYPHFHEGSGMLNYSKHPDGTWFAHNIELVDGEYRVGPGTKEKFAKRLMRLSNLLDSESIFVFLTIMYEQGMYPASDYEIVKNILRERTKGNSIFITVNLGNEPEGFDGEHFNFVIPQLQTYDAGLKGWEKLIADKIKEEIPHAR